MATLRGDGVEVMTDRNSNQVSAQDLADMMILGALQKGGSPAVFGFDHDGRLLGCSSGARCSSTTTGTISSTFHRPIVQSPPRAMQMAHVAPVHAQRVAPYPVPVALHQHAQQLAQERHHVAMAGWQQQQMLLRGGVLPLPACAFAQHQLASMAPMPLHAAHTLAFGPSAHPLGLSHAGGGYGGAVWSEPLSAKQRQYQHAHVHCVGAAWNEQQQPVATPHPHQEQPPSQLNQRTASVAPCLARTASAPQLGAPPAPAPRRASSGASERCRTLTCPYCKGSAFERKDELTAHIKACGLSFACSCAVRFQTRSKLMRHCRRCGHEPWRPPVSGAEQPWPASTAGSFSSGVESDIAGLGGHGADGTSVSRGAGSMAVGGCSSSLCAVDDRCKWADDKSYASLGADAAASAAGENEKPQWATAATERPHGRQRHTTAATAQKREPELRAHAEAAEAPPGCGDAEDTCERGDELSDLLSFFRDEPQDAPDETHELLKILQEF